MLFHVFASKTQSSHSRYNGFTPTLLPEQIRQKGDWNKLSSRSYVHSVSPSFLSVSFAEVHPCVAAFRSQFAAFILS